MNRAAGIITISLVLVICGASLGPRTIAASPNDGRSCQLKSAEVCETVCQSSCAIEAVDANTSCLSACDATCDADPNTATDCKKKCGPSCTVDVAAFHQSCDEECVAVCRKSGKKAAGWLYSDWDNSCRSVCTRAFPADAVNEFVSDPNKDPNSGTPGDSQKPSCRENCLADCKNDKPGFRGWLRSINDGRERFEATAYTGFAIDTFAAGEVNSYINPNDSSQVKERAVAGFDFAYRLVGNAGGSQQVWLFGETVHGVRSAETDCGNPNNAKALPACHSGQFPSATGGLGIIRNATSLEAFAGLRYEFLRLQDRWSPHPASLYLKAQAGFLTVAGNGGDVIDVRHVALGVVATNGRYQDSYFEAGAGRTDLFQFHPGRRFKVDGYLTWRPRTASGRRPLVQPFGEMTVDADLGPGSDSIQTYVGLNFDLDELGWK
ncbi:MAG: hypothetical protein HY049_14850 [Acidobacteria bacterium]|nr:hypothetical protein [Acidobacteriota bacterium]